MSHTAPVAGPSRRRLPLDTTAVLAVLLPLLTVAALALVRPEPTAPASATAPLGVPLTTVSLVCPSPLGGDTKLHLSTAEDDNAGRVWVRSGDTTTTVRLTKGSVTMMQADQAAVVTGEGDFAPGLLAARFGADGAAARSCAVPAADQWFTGLGSGAERSSIIELVNPDGGRAIADIWVYAMAGPLEVPALRGVSVPGHSRVQLDLGELVPRRGELALHVVTSRGRLATSVLDRYDQLGTDTASSDWLPPQSRPLKENYLLGLPSGKGTRTLLVANPGDSEVIATVKVVTKDSIFAPDGVGDLRIEPGSVSQLVIDGKLEDAVLDGGLGLQVVATGPVTATLRSLVRGDLSYAIAGTTVREASRVLAPLGPKRVLITGATAEGTVTVAAWSRTGKRLARRVIEVAPGQGYEVPVPDAVGLISVVTEGTTVVASVLVTDGGAAVLSMRELLRSGLVPGVQPGLP